MNFGELTLLRPRDQLFVCMTYFFYFVFFYRKGQETIFLGFSLTLSSDHRVAWNIYSFIG